STHEHEVGFGSSGGKPRFLALSPQTARNYNSLVLVANCLRCLRLDPLPARMGVPQVVIVGRPNVGKSSIFNWLAGKRLSIDDDQAGVTRDRVTFLLERGERFFELVDTGGMGIQDVDDLTEEIEEQIEAGIDSADVILFVVDTRAGVTPLDHEVAK